jgi:hypothetical protein
VQVRRGHAKAKVAVCPAAVSESFHHAAR